MSLVLQRNGMKSRGGEVLFPPPPRDFEVFVNNIPLSVSKQELASMFEKYGDVYTLRLVERSCGYKNYAFVRFAEKSCVRDAVLRWNGYEIRRGHRIYVSRSVENKNLVLCSLPRDLSSGDIYYRIEVCTAGLEGVDVYAPRDGRGMNSGIAVLRFENHTSASIAKKVLISMRHWLWDHSPVHVVWHTPGLITDERAGSDFGGQEAIQIYSAPRAQTSSIIWATSFYVNMASEAVLHTEISTAAASYGNGLYWNYGGSWSLGSNEWSCNF